MRELITRKGGGGGSGERNKRTSWNKIIIFFSYFTTRETSNLLLNCDWSMTKQYWTLISVLLSTVMRFIVIFFGL